MNINLLTCIIPLKGQINSIACLNNEIYFATNGNQIEKFGSSGKFISKIKTANHSNYSIKNICFKNNQVILFE